MENKEYSEKSWLATLLLSLFFGLGLHRFYVGKIGTGILYILTLGGFGFWGLIDLILIVCGKFKDKNKKYVVYEQHRYYIPVKQVYDNQESAEDKLSKLKKMYEKKIIDKKEYEQKRKEIISKI